MHDPTTLLKMLTEYISSIMLLALTFYCWHLDRRGRASETLRASYVALVCLLLLVMALPLKGV